jgi:hypothetical protein
MAHNHKGCSGCEELSEKLEKEKEEKHSNCKKAVIANEEKIGKLEKKLFAVVGKELADKIIDALDNVEKVQERLEEKISLPADVTSSLPSNDFSFDYAESVRRLVQIQNEKKENNLVYYKKDLFEEIPSSFVPVVPIQTAMKEEEEPVLVTPEQSENFLDFSSTQLDIPPLRLVSLGSQLPYDGLSDIDFAAAAISVPAPGFFALLCFAGLVGSRRR